MSLDGNDSAKRMKVLSFRNVGDTRTFQSDNFIPPDEADGWARDRTLTRGPEVPLADGKDSWEDVDEMLTENVQDVEPAGEGEQPARKDGEISNCVKNWKAAQTDGKKKRAIGMFDETGWFACGCRHGLIFWVVDMIQSGELYVHVGF